MTETESYKSRLRQEYWELKSRFEKLTKMLVERESGTLGYETNCPFNLLEEQEHHMREYLRVLEHRAAYEGVDLDIKEGAP